LSRIYYHDPRGFGTLKFCRSRAELLRKLSSLGPDLLDGATAAEDFVRAASSCRPATNVCRFLMDQTKVSGIGNYLLAEGLYKARVDPFCSLRELNRTRLEDLFQALRDTAADSYRSQAAAARQGEEGGGASFELCCYGRDRCLLRNDPVRKEAPGPHGRTIWYTDAQLFVPRDQRTSGGGSGRRHDPTTAAATATTTTSRSSKRALAVGAFEGAALAIKQGKGSVAGGEAAGSASSAESVPSPGDWLVKGLREDSWREQLAPHLASESFRGLAQFLRDEYRSVAVYPLPSEVFAALNLVPLDRVRVVVVGQDPYHGPGQAHGLAFSVPRGVKRLPPSLRNILAELQDDVGMSDPPSSGCLTPWAERGVLLLNTVLTVRAGEPLSHASRGWEEFTDAVLEAVATYHSDRGVVFLLWGNPAHAKARSVLAVASRTSAAPSSHAVIKTSHPSPLAATKTSSPFLGSRCFSRANAALIERSYDPIDWSLS
jgi:uracil-DNA glycosylase